MALTIHDFFRHPWKQGGYVCKSGYISVLIESRKLTGRNIKTGNKLKKPHGSWLGSLGYMVIIDLLADLIDISFISNQGEYQNNFIKFIRQFFNLSYDDACSIYALRCAFAHDFGLINNNKKYSELNKRFEVTQGSNNLIEIKYKQKGNVYMVDLEKLADLIEEFHKKVKNKTLYITGNIKDDLFISHK